MHSLSTNFKINDGVNRVTLDMPEMVNKAYIMKSKNIYM